MSAQIQTRDPVLAVALRDLENHAERLIDHEARIRPLEKLAVKLMTLSFIGAGLGSILIQLLLSLVK